MADPKFLDGYSGQTTEELLALAGEYRIDSLVLAFEEAIQQKWADEPIGQEESFVIAVEALEREVNNGGYSQFFVNASNQSAELVVEALQAIDCPRTADITREAIAALGVEEPLLPEKLEAAVLAEDEGVMSKLAKCDDRYYENNEPIAERLFEWIERNRARIRVGPT
jgi:Domain of unknown function (DUF4375)